MSRFIVLSDLHLHKWNYGATLKGKFNSRLMQQYYVLQQMEQYAKNNSIDKIFFCGDWFHKHSSIDSEVLMVSHSILTSWRNAGLKCVFLCGNHDFSDKEGDIHSLSFLNEFGLVVDNPQTFQMDDVVIHAYPYTEDEGELLKFLEMTPPNAIVLLHQGVSGVPVNSKGFTLNEALKSSMVPENATAVFAGHYHSFRQVTNKLFIPGTPMQLNWSDKGELRGWLDVYVKDGRAKVQQIESISPKFVEVDAENFSPDDEEISGNFVRIVDSDREAALKFKEEIVGRAESVEIELEEHTATLESPCEFTSIGSLFEEYVDSNKLPPRSIEVGKQLMEQKYNYGN